MASSIRIDRANSTPIYLQIAGQIAYEIGTGARAAGSRLGAIRGLATQLNVAPLTIVQAFSELERQGLVEKRPGVGTFVVDLGGAQLERVRKAGLEEAVMDALEGAQRKGFADREFAHALWNHVFSRSEQVTCRALFVGNFEDDTPHIADLISSDWDADEITVVHRSIEHLRHPDFETAQIMQNSDLVLTVPTRFTEVRKLIEADTLVYGIPIVLSPESRERISQIPATAKVGLVAREASYMQAMRNTLSQYCEQAASAPIANLDDTDQLGPLIREVDVIIYSMGVRQRVSQLILNDVMPVEMMHVPDPNALGLLREVVRTQGIATLQGESEITESRIVAPVG